MATSFKKKSSRGRVLQIPGTRPSIHNNQLLVSTGIPSLDSVIGGGIAVGTVLLVEEDIYGSYARQLLKYFLAEGIVSGHSLFLASAELEPSAILKDLPYPMNEEDDSEPGLSTPGRQEESMKIAWRYQQLPKVQSSLACSNFSHYFDLTRVMKEPRVHRLPITTFDATSEWSEGIQNPLYEKLISSLKQTICQGGYSTTHKQQQQKSILRLALHGLGSQLWGEACSATDFTTGLPRFLYCLRAQLRSSFAVCMVTMPTHVFQVSDIKGLFACGAF
ncbi:predicted protein [Nematostella vectensis]|uniref:Elongator complex protein 4 n=1 Tax=Nematostella vectensis TaxID=45351 RepID=A7S8W5_NEMVE|nr:predicted protein [Nematostella vectensis]|eukprot:XP_001631865.1 predicted protein [Nematostella vectensis]